MEKRYRALISVPISADSDDGAVEQAYEFANSVTYPSGEVVAGHLEFVGEVQEGSVLEVIRVVATITPPCGAMAPPINPVPDPRGTTGTFSRRHSRTTSHTCSAEVGRATASGMPL